MLKDNPHVQLQKIFDVQKWQELQDSLSEATGMAIITVDYKGTPISRHSKRQKFCGLVRNDEELSRHCQKCDSRGGLEAARLNKPYIYLCHYNILDAAIPILVDNKYVGAVMAGEVFLPTQEEMQQLEPICIPSNKKKLEKQTKQYNAYFEQIPTMSLDSVNRAVNMLFHLCNYIVGESLEKSLALSIALDCTDGQGITPSREMLSEYPTQTLANIKQSIDKAVTDAHIRQTASAEEECSSQVLKPAFRHMAQNKSEKYSLREMAELCHVSPSYFSRLFVRETGEKYSIYMLRRKVTWAKELLEASEKSVSEIGADVGFFDSAHFIKIFKKYEGITPARYRSSLG